MNGKFVLSADAQQFTACGDDFQIWACDGEVGDAWGNNDDLLHVVEDQQELAVAQGPTYSLDQRAIAGVLQLKGPRNLGEHQIWLAYRFERDEDNSIGIRVA